MIIDYEWRGEVDDAALAHLHGEGFGHPGEDVGRRARLERHSLGWVCARLAGRLVGFVNLAWDGGAHAFLLDTVVAADLRHAGVGRELVAAAVRGAREAGCDWLHVDFEEHLRPFYLEACGFAPTDAGLLRLGDRPDAT
ncbi:GNAT family N-acetyltransferase [Kitasatospora sp. NPDC088346]|uniref:GNAT family N-acetyltransferase n=1 Tax=Kitasatospora sp. NPDC088346 TaxID=3364073 RepID=UPI00382BF495